MKEYFVKRPIRRRPVHPGILLKEEVLPVIDMSVTEIAEVLSISRQHLYRILAGAQPISAALALKLSRLTKVSPTLLLNMQQVYDLWNAREDLKEELETISPATLREPKTRYRSGKGKK